MSATKPDPFIMNIVDSFMGTSRDVIGRGQELVPSIYFIAREHGQPAILPVIGISELFETKEGKRLLRPLIKAAWHNTTAGKPELKLVAVVMIADSWVERVPTDTFNKMVRNGERIVPFAPKPGMEEALFVQLSFADKELVCEWPYVRANGVVVFSDKPNFVHSEKDHQTLLTGMWPL